MIIAFKPVLWSYAAYICKKFFTFLGNQYA